MPNLTTFDGGINRRLEESLLPPNQAVVYNNADPFSGGLRSFKDTKELQNTVKHNFYKRYAEWISFDDADYTQFADEVYFTLAGKRPQVFDGKGYDNLGLYSPDISTIKTEVLSDYTTALEETDNASALFTSKYISILQDDEGDLPVDEDLHFRVVNNYYGSSSYRGARVYDFIVKADEAANYDTRRITFILKDFVSFEAIDLIVFRKIGDKFYTVEEGERNDGLSNKVRVDARLSDKALLELYEQQPVKTTDNVGTELEAYSMLTYTEWLSVEKFYIGFAAGTTDGTFSHPWRNPYLGFTQVPDYRQYAYTYYQESTGWESAPNVFSAEVIYNPHIKYVDYTGNDGEVFNEWQADKVKITGLPKSQLPDMYLRIYRLGDTLAHGSLIAELKEGETEFTDTVLDSEATDLLISDNWYPPNENMHSLVQAYGSLFGIVGDEVRFSLPGLLHAWPLENSIKLARQGTGLLPTPQGLLVFTATETYILLGTSPADFALVLLSDSLGSLEHKAHGTIQSLPIWVSYEGICTLQNNQVVVLSKAMLGNRDLQPVQAAVWDEQYFLLQKHGTILVADFRVGQSPRFYNYNPTYAPMHLTIPTGIGAFDGKLYLEIEGKLHECFAGEPLRFDYLSPVLTDGQHTLLKSYNKVSIRSKGVFDFTLFIDGKRAINAERLEGDKLHEVMVPAEMQRGTACQVAISGIGTVHEILISPHANEQQ